MWYHNDCQWQQSRSRTQTFHSQGESGIPTNPLHRATVQEHDTKLTLTGYGNIDIVASKPKGIAALVQHQFGWEWKWELTIIGNLQLLLEDVQNGHGYAISDGSFQIG